MPPSGSNGSEGAAKRSRIPVRLSGFYLAGKDVIMCMCRRCQPARSPFSSQTSRARPACWRRSESSTQTCLRSTGPCCATRSRGTAALRWTLRATRSSSRSRAPPMRCAAAGAAQRGLADGPVRVRIGVHTGEPIVTAEGYVGADVHRAARIMSAGHGGQVLVSETTRQLLDASMELRDLGDHRLKDLGAPQRLFQLGDGAFPPLKTLHRTTLPVQATPIVGRERELAEAGALVRAHRLLTLTGPGGSGKTRLAMQLAAEAIEQFPDGVFWVPSSGTPRPGPGRRRDRRGHRRRRPRVRLHREQVPTAPARQLRADRGGRADGLVSPVGDAEHEGAGHEPGAVADRIGAAVPGRAVAGRRRRRPVHRASRRCRARIPGDRPRRRDLPAAGRPAARDRAGRRTRRAAEPGRAPYSTRQAPAAPGVTLARRARQAANPARDDRVEL